MKVSRKKCILVASDIKVGRSLQHSLREFSFKYVPAAKNLGVDFKLAFNKGRQVTNKRITIVRGRVRRYRAFRFSKKPIQQVFRGGGTPAAMYGVGVVGMSSTALQKQRATTAAALFGPAKGRCRAVQFLLAEVPQ
eukprot:1610239-Pyramimonas_sp.AAC.1